GQGRVGRAAHEPRTPLSPLPDMERVARRAASSRERVPDGKARAWREHVCHPPCAALRPAPPPRCAARGEATRTSAIPPPLAGRICPRSPRAYRELAERLKNTA